MTRDELEEFAEKILNITWVEEEIKKWEWRETLVAQNYEGMPKGTGTSKDQLLKILIKMEKLEEWYLKKIQEACLLQLQFEEEIAGIKENEQRLMRLKYIEGMTFKHIADELGYSERHTQRKHGKILAKIA